MTDTQRANNRIDTGVSDEKRLQKQPYAAPKMLSVEALEAVADACEVPPPSGTLLHGKSSTGCSINGS